MSKCTFRHLEEVCRDTNKTIFVSAPFGIVVGRLTDGSVAVYRQSRKSKVDRQMMYSGSVHDIEVYLIGMHSIAYWFTQQNFIPIGTESPL